MLRDAGIAYCHFKATSAMLIPDVQVSNYTRATPPAVPLMANWLLLVAKAVLLVVLPFLLLTYTLVEYSLGGPRASEAAPPLLSPSSARGERVVLVTGVAGFVGSHVALELVRQWGARVVGLDNFNDYYDVQLKKDRASELVRAGVRVHQADLCDRPFLCYLFERYNFSHVVHMAAQAGVRHSLLDPVPYVRANMQCFVTLLDVLKESKHTSLVYASSSSVYGQGAPLPFSPHFPPLPPSNMYAALKASNEHFAHAYCSQYGLRATGLRLFTVYGPWGRPDMAVYKFALSIMAGKPVPLFEASASQPILRDFTYVADTVGGVLSALDHTPFRCGVVYNLGHGQPVAIATMLAYLQEELGQAAVLERSPLPPSDLSGTFADISDSQRELGFHPNISLKEGIRRFVSWFKNYYQQRKEWEENGLSQERNKLLEASLQAGAEEVARVQWEARQERNAGYQRRMRSVRDRYHSHAAAAGIPLPNLRKRGFVHYPGVDSPGATVIKAPGYQGSQQLLEERCLATEQCVGFTSNGEFKNRLRPMEQWTNTSAGQGLYVADMDMCAADLHDCDRHADCHSTGPGMHSCTCHQGYVRLGRSCVQRYVEGVESEGERLWRLSDEVDGSDWEALTRGRDFVFFQGVDSPGGDYLIVGGAEGGEWGLGKLEEACRHTYRCIAFNTNGILKHSLKPPSGWVQWTSHPEHGLYVLDTDYCSLSLEQCPPHSHCEGHGPANYSCVCEPPWLMTTEHLCTLPQEKELADASIHVLLSVDETHLLGLVGVVSSVLRHAREPGRLQFHVVVAQREEKAVEGFLRCFGLASGHQVTLVPLEVGQLEAWLGAEPRVYSRQEEVGNLASSANFARFLFPRLFPSLTRAIYLDADTVVQSDITPFWEQLMASDRLLLAVPRKSPAYGMFSGKVKRLFQDRYGRSFLEWEPTFNAGVFGVNLELWRLKDVHKEVVFWMKKHAQDPLWRLGTQPIMLMVAHGQWEELGTQWNVNGLGWNEHLSEAELQSAHLLHWSGRRKPWLSDGLYRSLWQAHLPAACGGRGQCVGGAEEGFSCRCKAGYSGLRCQNVLAQ